MKSINEIIKCAYKKWKDKEYLFEKTGESFTSMTFGVFLRKVTELAVFLIKNGLKDQKILIFGENSVSYMISDLAVLAYVGISVNVNAQTCKEELVEIMKTVGISAVLYDHHQTDLFRDIAEEIPEITYFCMQDVLRELSLDAPDGSNELNESNELNGSNKSNEAGERELHIVFEEKDETVCSKIIYSSGTTSDPKGIMLSLKNIFSGWQPLQKRTPFSENDVIYLFLPLHHTYANIYNFLYSLLSGASIYLCSGTDQIEAELKQVEPTIFCAVPLIYRRIYEHYKEHLPTAFGRRIKYLYCGGAKFDPLLRRVYKECGLPMFEAYALTETASSFCIEYPNRDDFESVGTIFETLDVKIADQDENGVGEILVKGENVFLGYVNNESLTRKAFTEDGYFITGDYGTIKDQKLYLSGRKNDMIVSENGENVYIKEVEQQIKKYSKDILKLQAAVEDGKIIYRIFIKEGSGFDPKPVLEDYNSKVTKKDRIIFYDILYTQMAPLQFKHE